MACAGRLWLGCVEVSGDAVFRSGSAVAGMIPDWKKSFVLKLPGQHVSYDRTSTLPIVPP
jgi:hypothetical protein